MAGVETGLDVAGLFEALGGVVVTNENMLAPLQNGARSLVSLRPPTYDNEISGISIKVPDVDWGVGQDYSEGQFLLLIGNSASGISDNTTVSKTITNIANTSPVGVTTSTNHGLSTGDTVRLHNTGIPALEGVWWKITVTGATTFTLNGAPASGAALQGNVFTNRSSVLFRVDNVGGIGSLGGLHVAPGLRGNEGQSFDRTGATNAAAAWIAPAIDANGLLITNPSEAEWPPVPVSDMMRISDRRGAGAPYDVLQVTSTGVFRSRKAAIFNSRLVADDSLTIEAIAGQTGEAFLMKDSGGVKRFRIDAAGTVYMGADATAYLYIASATGGAFGARSFFAAGDPAVVPMILRGAAGQSVDLFIVQINGPTAVLRVDKNGYLWVAKTAAPVDADITNGQVTLYWDAANGNLKYKGKQNNGNSRNAMIWTDLNMGPGSFMNADLLDGQQGAWYQDRANHTGTQTSATISDFNESVQDQAAALLTAGTHTRITPTYDDANNKVNLAVDDPAVNTVADSGSTSGAITFNLSQGYERRITLNGAMSSLAFSNVPAAKRVAVTVLYIASGAARSIPLPGGGVWETGSAPADIPAGSSRYIVYITENGGANWRCSYSGLFATAA